MEQLPGYDNWKTASPYDEEDVRGVEEYVKGSCYAPLFEGRFEDGMKTTITKDGKQYAASKARNCDWYCVDTGNKWLHGTREWFIENGYEGC